MNAVPPKTPPMVAERVSRPSVLRYQRMVVALAAADHALHDGAHPLAASIDALHAVMQFLGDDGELRNAGISRALRRLLRALHDTAHGVENDLLSRIGDPTRGPPKHRSEDYSIRGPIIAAIRELIRAGFKNEDAAKMIAKMATGISYKGKPITHKWVLQWREQVGATSPAAADEMALQISELLSRGRSQLSDTKESAVSIATMLIAGVRRENSN